MSKQILRSATSIGANIAESSVAQSKKDFLHKLFIAYKEAEETKYWLNLLIKSNYFNNYKELHSLKIEITSILKILNKIVHQTRNNLQKSPPQTKARRTTYIGSLVHWFTGSLVH